AEGVGGGNGQFSHTVGSGDSAVALLVFLAAAARARVVAADLLGGHRLTTFRLGGVGGDPGRSGRSHGGRGGRIRFLSEVDVEEVADRVALHRLDQVLEHVVGLALVLAQRVPLAHGAQTDPGAQVVHVGEVLPPFVV